MNTYLVMIEIVTSSKEFKTYSLLKSDDIKQAQGKIDAYLRDNGNMDRDFDYSMTSVEKVDRNDTMILEKYIDFLSIIIK